MSEEIRRTHPLAVRCRSCGAAIVWFFTASMKKMPVNEESTLPTDRADQLDLNTVGNPRGRHVSHFSTCPNADEHRRKP